MAPTMCKPGRSITVDWWPIAYKHLLAIFERVHYDGLITAKANLQDGIIVLKPPLLAQGGVVGTEKREMTNEWKGSWDFREAIDEFDTSRS